MTTDSATTSPNIPVIGFVAQSGTGKTTLITRLIPLLKQLGIRIAVIKHSHHNFDIDKPGKDSYEIRQAGAIQSIIASKYRIASIYEFTNNQREPELTECLKQVDRETINLIIVEGFKQECYSKIEVHRAAVNAGYLYPEDQNIIAVVSDSYPGTECTLPVFDINHPAQVAEFLVTHFKL